MDRRPLLSDAPEVVREVVAGLLGEPIVGERTAEAGFTLLPDLALSGHDPDAVLRRSCWRDVPAEDVNVALAGLAGRAWRDCALSGDSRLRSMQREQAECLLSWLDARLRRG